MNRHEQYQQAEEEYRRAEGDILFDASDGYMGDVAKAIAHKLEGDKNASFELVRLPDRSSKFYGELEDAALMVSNVSFESYIDILNTITQPVTISAYTKQPYLRASIAPFGPPLRTRLICSDGVLESVYRRPEYRGFEVKEGSYIATIADNNSFDDQEATKHELRTRGNITDIRQRIKNMGANNVVLRGRSGYSFY